MAAKDFILKYGNTRQTLADWGISDCQFDHNDFAADTVTFIINGRPFDASDLFDYGSTIEIFYPNGTRWFYGRVEPWERNGTFNAEGHFGRLVGPWFYFERLYKQRFRRLVEYNTNQLLNVYQNIDSPRVILNVGQDQSVSGPDALGFVSWTTGQQLADVVNYAASIGFPVQLGHVAPWSSPFSSEQKGITMAAVIQMMFQREPDFTCVWDYTTTPPTIHFLKTTTDNLDPSLSVAQQAALVLAEKIINLDTDVLPDQFKIKPRPDWLRSKVKIHYDQTNIQTGEQYLNQTTDIYPLPEPMGAEAEVSALELFVDLAGYNQSTQIGVCQFTSVPFDPTDINQWVTWKASLGGADVVAAEVLTDATTDDATIHPSPFITSRETVPVGPPTPYNPANFCEITDGHWAPWMTDNAKRPVTAQKVRVNAWIRLTKNRKIKNAAGVLVPETEIISVHADFVATSFNSGGVPADFTIKTTTITAYAEPVPPGLAKTMYKAWQSLAVEGSLTNVEDVISGSISRANFLNFISAQRPEWAAVNAPVRRLSGSLDQGTTRIDFGAPLAITGNALVEIYRSTRFRVTNVNLAFFFGGALGGGGGGTIQHPQKAHPRSIEHGTPQAVVHVVSQSANPTTGVDPIMHTDGATGITTWTPPGPAGAPATGSIIIDPSKLKGADNLWHTMQLQEVVTCETVNGAQVLRTRLILASDAYLGTGQS